MRVRPFALPLALAGLLAAGAASGQAFVGKTVSLFAATDEGTFVAEPDTVAVASVAVPTKHRHKKSFLLITASTQESCIGGVVSSSLTVGGVEAVPSTLNTTECTDSGWAFRTRHWFLPPSSQGGPELPPDALVELRLRSDVAGYGYGARTLRVETAR
jgi:hypothetical protein